MLTFSAVLRDFRLSLSMTQQALAAQLGCSPSTISAYERAERKRYMPYLLRLAALMRKPVEQLLPKLLALCPASERLLLQGELDYQRQLENVQANKARQRTETRQLLLRKLRQKQTNVQLQARSLLEVCGGELPPAYIPQFGPNPAPADPVRLYWDRCDVERRLLLCSLAKLQLSLTEAQKAQKAYHQGALRWQQAFRHCARRAA